MAFIFGVLQNLSWLEHLVANKMKHTMLEIFALHIFNFFFKLMPHKQILSDISTKPLDIIIKSLACSL